LCWAFLIAPALPTRHKSFTIILMSKHKVEYKHYDKDHPYLSTLSIKKRANYVRTQKMALRIVVVLFFVLAEGMLMWATADSSISYSPLQKEVLVGVKSPKKVAKAENISAPPPSLSPFAADMYLVVPKLYINAPIENVGVTANGEMATSQSLERVAWYKDGKRPGDIGSAVMAGHYGGPNEIGIFRSTDKLVVGDTIEVRDKSGNSTAFKVYKVARYQLSEVPLQEIFNKADGKYLNLITCVGNWNNSNSTYDQRLIVFSKQD